MHFSRRDFWLVLTTCSVCLLSSLIVQKVFAYDPQVEGDLNYSRNALLKQRSEIELACDRKMSQVAQLQNEIDRLHKYLEDTDRSLRYIDSALKGE
ncbi:MAG: hypothetical protein P4L53_04170 [Candidatus Obscuribacterales bacterium]|nr:hypothetical protein [Candidatus Obscuribacterales bacterium]